MTLESGGLVYVGFDAIGLQKGSGSPEVRANLSPAALNGKPAHSLRAISVASPAGHLLSV